MTSRQKILKKIYPLFIWWNKIKGRDRMLYNNTIEPNEPFYSLKVTLNNGDVLDCASLKGKKVLLVNTASDCGYTPQYDALQELYDKHGHRLTVIGFPSNEFGGQEQGNDEEIAAFCRKNFGVSFPLAKKTAVVPGPGQNPVFEWLTKKELNGWNGQAPNWNFAKYLVNENGMLTHFFAPSVTPLSDVVVTAIG